MECVISRCVIIYLNEDLNEVNPNISSNIDNLFAELGDNLQCEMCAIIKNTTDEEVYFKDPIQILTILRDLEETNLRLIQHCQESDDSVEILRNQVNETVDNYEKDIHILSQHQTFLKGAIDAEQNKTQYFSLSMRLVSD
ncbi:unnamed protein product [Schistosoma mattheei]|uniref:Uncharacterized protein n=1 Tax=Schistosoma mattheei TaxID=31246 RepID=A0A183NIE5_9TREM|nr:unnamed protein product [Schistosoma mattheei]